MSENELKSEVLKEVEDSGMQASDEDLSAWRYIQNPTIFLQFF